jgi:hypothetical protein
MEYVLLVPFEGAGVGKIQVWKLETSKTTITSHKTQYSEISTYCFLRQSVHVPFLFSREGLGMGKRTLNDSSGKTLPQFFKY